MGSPEFEAWKNRARDTDPRDVAERLGIPLKKSGGDWVASCPVCGGKDRNEFIVTPGNANPAERWLCRKANEGGDVIAMHMHVTGSDFIGACEEITGEPPPNGEAGRRSDPEAIRERRQERADDQARRDAEQAQKDHQRVIKAADLWTMRKPIRKSWAARYLSARGIELRVDEENDLGFAVIPYYGYQTRDDDEAVLFGEFPAMLAAIRDTAGELIAVHRTYLDPKEPRKYRPPGDPARNKAKKIVGRAGGGFIRLGPVGDMLAVGEGIETTLAWRRLERAGEDVTIAAAVSIGNLAGSAMGSIAHPKLHDRQIPNGIPDLDRPGVVWPDAVKEVILLGDGDSDPEWTRAVMLTAARRFRAGGLGVLVDFAPPGHDWNDVLMGRWNG